MTGTAAEKMAKQAVEKDKEKAEKRRALGRGLDSLLPRVVAGASAVLRMGTAPVEGATGGQQVPRRGFATTRNDNTVNDNSSEGGAVAGALSSAVVGDIHGVVEDDGAASVVEIDDGGRTGVSVPYEIMAQAEGRTPANLIVNIALEQIDRNPHQTRRDFDSENLEELALSIRAQGVVQPVVVRPGEDGRYILILGERRCRASKLAGKTTVPAIVRRVSEQQAAEMTIIENLQREDLNCMEQAAAFGMLSQEFGLTQQQIGERVGLSRESVSNYMRLLKLPPTVIEYLKYDKLDFSAARELMRLEDAEKIAKTADDIVKKHMSLEQVEDLVMHLRGLGPPPSGMDVRESHGTGARWVDPNVRAAQTDLERLLGVRVRIRDRKGRGKIVIEYHTVDDYDRVVGMLRGKK